MADQLLPLVNSLVEARSLVSVDLSSNKATGGMLALAHA